MAKHIRDKMDLSTAVSELDGQLPNDVASLVHMTTSGKSEGQLDEDSMQKASKLINLVAAEILSSTSRRTYSENSCITMLSQERPFLSRRCILP
jgi:hypothetical protein